MRIALYLVIGLFAVAPGALAQAPTNRHALEGVIPTIPVGKGVRVQAGQFGRLSGKFVSGSAEALILDVRGTQQRIALPDVDRLWVRGRATKTGAIVGAITAGVPLAFLTLVGGSIGCSDDGIPDNCKPVLYLAAGGLVGGLGGGLVGALIGSAIPKWRQKYP